jgi:hypothetical protein
MRNCVHQAQCFKGRSNLNVPLDESFPPVELSMVGFADQLLLIALAIAILAEIAVPILCLSWL